MAAVFIDGAAGTTGLEIAQRLAGRDDIRLIALADADRKLDEARRAAMAAADITILCLPDDAARAAVGLAAGLRHVRIIDASSAHRTAPGWTYGFAELGQGQMQRIASSARVSNPGCYPTGFLALVAPLVAAGLIAADAVLSVNAVSGYSGGGKALIARFAAAAAPAYRSYGLGMDHKHLAEMQHYAGVAHPPIFAPAVIPAYRGMLVEVPVALAPGGAARARAILAETYADSALVGVSDVPADGELCLASDAPPSDRIELFVAGNADGTRARLIARLDNLGKGASGACVQNLNLMAGLPMLRGLLG